MTAPGAAPVPSPAPDSPAERRRILVLLTLTMLLYFFANFQRTVIPGSIFSELQHDFDASAAGITGLGASFMYLYAVSQLFSGVLADRFGGYRLITVGGALFCLGSLLFPLSHNLPQLYGCRLLTGLGASAIYLSMVKEIQRACPANFALTLGVGMLVGYAGSMAANAPFVAAIRVTGWRLGLIGVGAVLAALWGIFVLLRFTVKLPPPGTTPFRIRAFAPATKKRHNWALYLLTGLAFAVFYTFQTVLGKKFLEDYCCMTAIAAGWIMTLTGALSALASFLTPVLSKCCGDRRRPFMRFMGLGTLLCTAGPLLAIAADRHWAWFFCGAFLVLACCSNMGPIFMALVAETNPVEHLGVCASFSNCLAYLMVALLGNLAGVLMDCFEPAIVDGVRVYGARSYLAVFALCTAVGATAFALSLTVKETRGRPLEVR